jgi:hypothetical protein
VSRQVSFSVLQWPYPQLSHHPSGWGLTAGPPLGYQPPAPSNLPQPNTKLVMLSYKAYSEVMMGSMVWAMWITLACLEIFKSMGTPLFARLIHRPDLTVWCQWGELSRKNLYLNPFYSKAHTV